MTKATTGGVLSKNHVFQNFTKFTGKHLCQSLLFNKVNFIKKHTLTKVFSCQFWEIFKNTVFTEQLRATAIVMVWKLLFDEVYQNITFSFMCFILHSPLSL